ncbi:hypothetical protein ACFL2H_00935 [Planctomycetota bacterium]
MSARTLPWVLCCLVLPSIGRAESILIDGFDSGEFSVSSLDLQGSRLDIRSFQTDLDDVAGGTRDVFLANGVREPESSAEVSDGALTFSTGTGGEGFFIRYGFTSAVPGRTPLNLSLDRFGGNPVLELTFDELSLTESTNLSVWAHLEGARTVIKTVPLLSSLKDPSVLEISLSDHDRFASEIDGLRISALGMAAGDRVSINSVRIVPEASTFGTSLVVFVFFHLRLRSRKGF